MDIFWYDDKSVLVVEWPSRGIPSVEYEQDGTLSVFMNSTWIVNRGKVAGSDTIVRWRG